VCDHTNRTYCKTAAQEEEDAKARTAEQAFQRFDCDPTDAEIEAIENALLNQHEHDDDDATDDASGNSSRKKRKTTFVLNFPFTVLF
jgi:hypothetical protein